LQLTAVVELEIFLLEVGNDFALDVADYDADKHIVDADLECGGRVTAGDFLSVSGGGRLSRLLRRLVGLSGLIRRGSTWCLGVEAVSERELGAEKYG